MLQQAIDFREESEVFFALLNTIRDQEWKQKTQFKGWTINDVVAHVHLGNYAADLSLRDSAAFTDFMQSLASARTTGRGHLHATHAWLRGIKDRALLQQWRAFYLEMAERFAVADPKRRVKWVGPDMSVRSSITARLMETWAHAQAVYDVLGQVRNDTDRIKNIAVLGINTFGWSFANRGLAVPAEIPTVRLTAPSGAVWEWGQSKTDNLVEGSAVEFCQVVTQVRNLADTALRVVGATATHWMSIAQCFAGPPEEPPAPGSRFRSV
ncbi:MAG TPA: TIGR03084 family metal-binding protein [Candidatus Binatia bacterium]|nr:TIGR03084 family metal-binding protein [Candidatus Binatia bacterium]